MNFAWRITRVKLHYRQAQVTLGPYHIIYDCLEKEDHAHLFFRFFQPR